AFRDAEPLAHVIFPKTQEEVLDLLGPSWEDVKHEPERRPLAINPQDRAVAIAALKVWSEELRAGARTPETFDALWIAACSATDGLEMERAQPSSAAEAFATARVAFEDAIASQDGRAA